jgi:LemA protein
MAALSIPIIILLLFVGILVIAAIWAMTSYNSLVALRQAVKNAWAQIDVQLKRLSAPLPRRTGVVRSRRGECYWTLGQHSTGLSPTSLDLFGGVGSGG